MPMKARRWSQRQLKKARWKRSLQRAKKRGPVYGGFIRITDDFKITECTAEKIIVSREPRNETEESIMRLTSQDAVLRKWLEDGLI
jgi:hypothetical protein